VPASGCRGVPTRAEVERSRGRRGRGPAEGHVERRVVEARIAAAHPVETKRPAPGAVEREGQPLRQQRRIMWRVCPKKTERCASGARSASGAAKTSCRVSGMSCRLSKRTQAPRHCTLKNRSGGPSDFCHDPSSPRSVPVVAARLDSPVTDAPRPWPGRGAEQRRAEGGGALIRLRALRTGRRPEPLPTLRGGGGPGARRTLWSARWRGASWPTWSGAGARRAGWPSSWRHRLRAGLPGGGQLRQ